MKIYTDGACSGNPGPGAWGAVLSWDGKQRTLSGAEAHTTNNRMELIAAIRACEALKRPMTVEVYSDSSYLIKGMTEWLKGWKRRGWKRQTGALENEDLWRRLDELNSRHRIKWHWVAGHAGHTGNEQAHKVAAEALRTIQAR